MKTTTVKVNTTVAGIDQLTQRPYPIKFKPGNIETLPDDVATELGAHNKGGAVTEVSSKDTTSLAKANPLHPAWEHGRAEAAKHKTTLAKQQQPKAATRELR